MLKWLVIGYFLLVFYWIKCMFLSQERREEKRAQGKRKHIFQFRKVKKQESAISKAVYNPKEFRRRRD